MSDVEALIVGPAPEPDDHPNGHGSLLERLREQRASRAPAYLDIVIPNLGQAEVGDIEIIARMRRIPFQGQAAQAIRRLQRAAGPDGNASAEAELGAECDVLMAGLEQLYAREGDSEPVPLDPDNPMRFDYRTAEALGIHAERAREIVFEIFGGPLGQWALKAAAGQYVRWLQNLEVVSPEEGKG